jgi:soluble lytic murein transglycosylase-like protein
MIKLFIVLIVLNLNTETQVPIVPLLRLIEIESGFDYRRVSYNPNGTRDYGVMQLNAKYLDYYSWKFNDGKKIIPSNINDNVKVGLRYLRFLYDKTGTWRNAFTAYNCGLSRFRSGNIPKSTMEYIAFISERKLPRSLFHILPR